MTDNEKTMEEVVKENMYDEEIWNEIQTDDVPYIIFDPDIEKVLTFTSNDPVEIYDNDYGSETWDFEVLDIAGSEKTLSVSSKRLKRALFQAQPLISGRLGITKTGESFETRYTVVKLDE